MVVKKITIKYAPEPTVKKIDPIYKPHRPRHSIYYEERYLCESPVSPSVEIDAIPWTLDPHVLNLKLFAALESQLDQLITRVLDGGSDRLPRWTNLSAALFGYLVVRCVSPVEVEDIEADVEWFWEFVCSFEKKRREDEFEFKR
jgi:hypothetical protein